MWKQHAQILKAASTALVMRGLRVMMEHNVKVCVHIIRVDV